MLKQVLLVVLLSIIAVFFAHQLNLVLHWIVSFHQLLAHTIDNIFAGGKLGHFIREVVALLLPPLLIAVVIELLMRLIKQDSTRYASYGLWVTWIVLLVLVGLR